MDLIKLTTLDCLKFIRYNLKKWKPLCYHPSAAGNVHLFSLSTDCYELVLLFEINAEIIRIIDILTYQERMQNVFFYEMNNVHYNKTFRKMFEYFRSTEPPLIVNATFYDDYMRSCVRKHKIKNI